MLWNYRSTVTRENKQAYICMLALICILSCFSPECSGPLGMEGGIISNQQITASSTHRALFGLQKWYPYFARLNKKGLVNAWTAAENDRWPWIQVRLLHKHWGHQMSRCNTSPPNTIPSNTILKGHRLKLENKKSKQTVATHTLAFRCETLKPTFT